MNNSLVRRIKSHVKSQVHEIFAICPPGFENTLVSELIKLEADIEVVTVSVGGVLIKCKLDILYQLHLTSGVATRFLLRISSFKATNFLKLVAKVKDIPWELYINPESTVEINASCSKSRLYHSDAVKERTKEAIDENLQSFYKERTVGSQKQTVFIRIDSDTVTISLDATGMSLYKRGYKTLTAKAALRENIARAILIEANVNSFQSIIDPMCGTGTFICETLLEKNLIAPFKRNYTFETWPVFSQATYNFIVKKIRENVNKTANNNVQIIGMDNDKKNIPAALENLKRLNGGEVPYGVSCIVGDFFKSEIENVKNNLIVLNPPYGKRIGKDIKAVDLFKKIGKKIKASYPESCYAIIVPSEEAAKALDLVWNKKIEFSNGGLSVAVVFGNVNHQ